ncbi:gluconokinase [Mesorhizobium sp. CU2]|uniref:gluconokinase n=1 Tax=unclassified Mesorhizobium TaxID=325217 RepID=UPI0011288F3B|nr:MULTISPECIES: gluconokinase [unclassified Mesorhizobium]TPN89411.1 gluconokinase [Mesorhizobium sp. CU3]TPO22225.1 gluconokinase [Mesorhizobium sp. CU2]
MSMAASRLRSDPPPRMVVMGVTGSGKTTVGEALAEAIGAIFVDGDRLHPEANIAKMSAGIPLDDDDRWPWLAKVGETLRQQPAPVIVGCSALKRAYRDFIAERAGAPVLFIYLAGSRELISSRMHERTGHFMPTSLLDSQFATLEAPAKDENAIAVPIDAPLDRIVADITAKFGERAS